MLSGMTVVLLFQVLHTTVPTYTHTYGAVSLEMLPEAQQLAGPCLSRDTARSCTVSARRRESQVLNMN
jgi:hypothetical protein